MVVEIWQIWCGFSFPLFFTGKCHSLLFDQEKVVYSILDSPVPDSYSTNPQHSQQVKGPTSVQKIFQIFFEILGIMQDIT